MDEQQIMDSIFGYGCDNLKAAAAMMERDEECSVCCATKCECIELEQNKTEA